MVLGVKDIQRSTLKFAGLRDVIQEMNQSILKKVLVINFFGPYLLATVIKFSEL